MSCCGSSKPIRTPIVYPVSGPVRVARTQPKLISAKTSTPVKPIGPSNDLDKYRG